MQYQSAHSKWKRRIISIPSLFLIFALLLFCWPLFLLISLLIDVFWSPRWGTTRAFLYIFLFVSCEVIGVIVMTLGWVRYFSQEGLVAHTAKVQRFWAWVLYRGMIRIFSMKVDLGGEELVKEGPLLVFLRHVSVGDTIIPSGLILVPHGILLRYVMKAELLWDPCLDIAGNRLRNLFIRREGNQRGANLEGIAALARDLGDQEGLVFYPEGTRFTPEKFENMREHLSPESPSHLVESMNRLCHVLPPKLGGSLTLLRAADRADVVFCAHSGLETVTKLSNLRHGNLVGTSLRVRFWRVARADIPQDTEAQEKWVLEQWEKMDRIVGELKCTGGKD